MAATTRLALLSSVGPRGVYVYLSLLETWMRSKLILFRGPCFGSRSHCPHGVDLLSLDLERLSVRFVMHKYAER